MFPNDLINDLNYDIKDCLTKDSLVHDLLEIQRSQIPGPRDFSWTKYLRCFSTHASQAELEQQRWPSRTLFATSISIEEAYVAVSYVWTDAANDQSHDYQIVDSRKRHRTARVSNTVLDRIIKYVDRQKLPCFWIDQESINQEDGQEKVTAIQTMDFVYRRSFHPIGIISKPVRRQRDLHLLAQLLRGSLTSRKSDEPPRLTTGRRKAREVLSLISYIVSDNWFHRRWTFSEDYCAFKLMRLLLPLGPCHVRNRDRDVLGDQTEEAVVNVAMVREQATLFCISCLRSRRTLSLWEKRRLKSVLRSIKAYKILESYGRLISTRDIGLTLSVRVVADICRRSSQLNSDTVAIAANCCGYAVRLNMDVLLSTGMRSLSIAILALFLLNGEIFRNDKPCDLADVLTLLRRRLLGGIQTPTVRKQLTFSKRYRLVNVRLCHAGVKTTGYVWKFHDVVDTRSMSRAIKHGRRPATEPRSRKKFLQQLARGLAATHPCLAELVSRLVSGDVSSVMRDLAQSKVFQAMVGQVARAVRRGQPLVTAKLCHDEKSWAIFLYPRAAHIESMFTAYEPIATNSSGKNSRFIEQYVSLAVHTRGRRSDSPILITHSWLPGLVFPESEPSDVIFPWFFST